MGNPRAWKQLWLVEFSDLDPNVGPNVKVHMVAAIEDISWGTVIVSK